MELGLSAYYSNVLLNCLRGNNLDLDGMNLAVASSKSQKYFLATYNV